jgi:acetoacetate decarboxylase
VRVDASEPFSTPGDAPLVPRMPFRFRDVQIVTAFYRSDIEAIRRLVPFPLEPVDDIVAIHVYEMNDTDHFGAYNESAVQVPVVYPATREHGVYSPYLFLDHDGGIAAGREVYGQPKKFGRPSIEVRHDLVVGTVERNGIDVVTLTVPYKGTPCSLEEMLARLDKIEEALEETLQSGGTLDASDDLDR